MDTVKDSKSYLQALHRLYDLLKTVSDGATSSIACNIIDKNTRIVLKNLLDRATREFYKAHPEMVSQLKFLSPVQEDRRKQELLNDRKGGESVTQVQPKRCRVCKKKKVVSGKQSVEAIQSAFSHPKVQSITETIASGPKVKSTVERIATAKGTKQTYDHMPTKRIQQNFLSAPKKRRPSLNRSNHYTSQSSKSYTSSNSYSSSWNSKDKGMHASASEKDSSTPLRSNDRTKSNSRVASEFSSQSHSSINSGSGVASSSSSSHQLHYGHRLRHGVKVKKTGDGANVKKKDGKLKRLKDGLKLVFHLNNHHNHHHHSPSKSRTFLSRNKAETYGKNVLQVGKKTPGKSAYKAEVERMVEKKHPAEKHIQGLIKSVLSHVEDASKPKELVSIAKSDVNKQKKAIKKSKFATTAHKAMKFRVGKRNLRIKSLPKFK